MSRDYEAAFTEENPFAWNRDGGALSAQLFGAPVGEDDQFCGLGKAKKNKKKYPKGVARAIPKQKHKSGSGPASIKAVLRRGQARRAAAAAGLAPAKPITPSAPIRRPAPRLTTQAFPAPAPAPAPIPLPAPIPAPAPVDTWTDSDITEPGAEMYPQAAEESADYNWTDEEIFAQEADELADEEIFDDQALYGWADENGYPRDLGFLKKLFKGVGKALKSVAPVALTALSLVPGPAGIAAGAASSLIPMATPKGTSSGQVKKNADGSLSAKIGALVNTPFGQGVLTMLEGVGLAVVDRLGQVIAQKVGTTWTRPAPIIPQPTPRPAEATQTNLTPLLIGGAVLLLAARK